MEKTIHFISGLPRSGSTLITNILKQNTQVHGEAVSSLSSVFGSINFSWNNFESNQEYPNIDSKKGVLKSIMQGYYSHIDKSIIVDRDRAWIPLIGQIEAVLEKKVKIIVCVRNPAEILTSFERLRKKNPLFSTRVDQHLRDGSNIATRAYYYAGPEGQLGTSHRNLKDAITMGYLDRFLFVDYNRFCNSPKSQTKRIYEFLELPSYEHDFENINQLEIYNDIATGLPDLHKIKSSVDRTVVNCVEYLGLDLYEQYNSQIFWNAWI
jgi:sulfotransferase